LHPKNLHNKPYPLSVLAKAHPPLAEFIYENDYNKKTIDFADAAAVFHLNKGLLLHYYGIKDWNIPEGYLCPPIPSRADYIHYINDLLSEVPLKAPIKALDVGTGANAIYALLASAIYGWDVVGCDIDKKAMEAAQENAMVNTHLPGTIEIRHQTNNAHIFEGIILPNEFYHVTICNPPFFTSAADANRNTLRKLKQLNPEKPVLELERNFKGQPNELWCNGGEALFIKRMIKQSTAFKKQVGWFTTLVSKSDNLPKIYKLLNKLNAKHQTLQMQHGSKVTRVVAWRFLS